MPKVEEGYGYQDPPCVTEGRPALGDQATTSPRQRPVPGITRGARPPRGETDSPMKPLGRETASATTRERPILLNAAGASLHPAEPTVSSLVDCDEYGPITGRPGGLFTAATIPSLRDERDDLGRRLADWVPADHLL